MKPQINKSTTDILLEEIDFLLFDDNAPLEPVWKVP